MKKYLFALLTIILFSSSVFANSFLPKTENESIASCRDFTVEVSIGIVSVSTEVTVCCEPNGFGSWNCWLEKNGSGTNGDADITSAINALKSTTNSPNIQQVNITGSNSVEFDDGNVYAIASGTYYVTEYGGKYFIKPSFVKM